MSKVIGIVGSRSRNTEEDYELAVEAFDRIYEKGDKLVSGGCPQGGDHFAEMIAAGSGLTLTIHYPAWKDYGKQAGFIRNTLIAEDCDVLIALVAKDRTGGTEDTIRKVKKAGKKVIIVE